MSRVVVITGGGQGLGRAYAKRFAELGDHVVVAELNAERGRAVAEEVGGEFVHTDVSDEASCAALATTIESHGRVDVLVNNAAVLVSIKMKPFWELSLDEWEGLMAVNLRGVWLTTRALVPLLKEAPGCVVNASSGVAYSGRANYLHYVASKGAVISMTRSMARELGDFGIRVNAIAPGPIVTEVPRDTVTPAQLDVLLASQCLKRIGEMEDVVGVVEFLASDLSRFVTGQTIPVDGGLIHV
jgi:3-oxoacyl-[acyl-carrier protein] reductase